MSRRTLVLPDEKRVRAPFVANRRVRAMAGMNDRVVPEGKQHASYGRDERRVIAAREIGAADRSGEKRVANEQLPADFALFSNLQTDPTRTMSRRVVRAGFERPEPDHLPRGEVDIDWRLRFDLQPEHR